MHHIYSSRLPLFPLRITLLTHAHTFPCDHPFPVALLTHAHLLSATVLTNVLHVHPTTTTLTTPNGTPLSIANHTPWDAICLSPTTFWQTRSQEMFEKIVEYVVVPDSGYDDVVIFGSSRAVIVEYSRRTTFVRFHPLTVTGRPTRYWLFDARVCVCNTIASLCGLSVTFDHVQVCGWRAQCDQR